MIYNLRHLAVEVHDLDAGIQFYEVLGFEEKSRDIESGEFIEKLTGIRNIKLKTCKMQLDTIVRLELICRVKRRKFVNLIKSKNNYLGHFSLSVQNIESESNRLIKAGAKQIGECVISEKSHSIHAVRARHAYLSDPWGNIIHLAEDIA